MSGSRKARRLGAVGVLTLLSLLAGITGLTAWAGRPGETPTRAFLPVILGSVCPTGQVSGTYYTTATDMVTDCPGGVALPLPADSVVAQMGAALSMSFPSGLSQGVIVPATGQFQVQQTIAASPLGCVYGCSRTTVGAFSLGQSPMAFEAITTFVVNGVSGPYCSFAFKHHGTRTQCAP